MQRRQQPLHQQVRPVDRPERPRLYEGGVLSDPGKTYALPSVDCTTVPEPYACSSAEPSMPAASPILTSYDAFDCQDAAYGWSFNPAGS